MIHTNNRKKGQAWSTDLMLAMVAFGIIVVVFYAVIASNDNKEIDTLQDDAQYLSNLIKNSGDSTLNSLITNNKLNDARLQAIVDDMGNSVDDYDDAMIYYNTLRERLNIDSDFCIFFGDTNKKAILVEAASGDCFGGIGNPNFNITGGIPCGMPVNC